MIYLNEIKTNIKTNLQNKTYSILHSNMLHDISYFTSPPMLRTSKLYSSSQKVQNNMTSYINKSSIVKKSFQCHNWRREISYLYKFLSNLLINEDPYSSPLIHNILNQFPNHKTHKRALEASNEPTHVTKLFPLLRYKNMHIIS